MSTDLLLENRDLRISFGTEAGLVRVLEGVNLAIRRGAIMGLVGESGCGKTTLARSVLGILPPNARYDGGSIHFDGMDILAMSRKAFERDIKGRRITFVPQDPYGSFNPLFRIGDQIMELMNGSLHGAIQSNGDSEPSLLLTHVRGGGPIARRHLRCFARCRSHSPSKPPRSCRKSFRAGSASD